MAFFTWKAWMAFLLNDVQSLVKIVLHRNTWFCVIKYTSSVTHEWFLSILSFITRGSTLWRSLVFNQICMTSVTSSYPMKFRVMYACCSSVSVSSSKFCSDEIWLVYMVHAYFKCKQANIALLTHGLERKLKLADSNPWFAMMLNIL